MSSKGLRLVAWALFGAGCIYGVSGATPSPGESILAALIAWFALAIWMERDAVTRRVGLAYDWPWLMILGWPVSYVWYARRTQRSWGKCAVLAAMPTLFIVGVLCGTIARLLVRSVV
ncbi:MAG TPA: hypothetical protein VF102_00590 [Gemmatimonadaceae bacterium]